MNSYNEKLKECLQEVYKCVNEDTSVFYTIYFHKEQWAPYFNFDFGAYFEDLLNPSDTEIMLFQLEYPHIKFCLVDKVGVRGQIYIMER